MFSLLLLIYLAFISLGLPDSVLGSAWPVMRVDLGADFALAGYIVMTVQACTIVSSLFSTRLLLRFGTGRITVVSVAMTALALLGYALAPSVGWLFVCAVPLGFGGGNVDAALNHFVAAHYAAEHMSWLHCFWGVGATTGPAIIALSLAHDASWRTGYTIIAALQAALVLVLLLTLPLWKRAPQTSPALTSPTTATDAAAPAAAPTPIRGNREALGVPLVKLALVSFVFFCATETTTGLWTSSYLVATHGLPAAEAARATSFFYGGITVGRFLSGLLAIALPSYILIRAGQIICVLGAGLLALPLASPAASLTGVIFLGLGTAPIFPNMLHETPRRFGAAAAQAVMGLQMAFAYIGSTCFPPLFGALAARFDLGLFPYFLLACALAMLAASELLQRKLAARC